MRGEHGNLVQEADERYMILDKRMNADTEADKILAHRTWNSVMAPSCVDTSLQVRQKINALEHCRCISRLEKVDFATTLELGEGRLTHICQAEKVTNAPKKCTGFEK